MRYLISKIIIVMAVVFVSLGAALVWAEDEERPTASADVGIFSKYIWRGYELSDDSFVIQPSATVGYKGFSFNLWGNLDTNFDDQNGATPDTSAFNETDLTLAYDTSVGPWSVGVGYIYYALDAIDDTQEIYVSLGYDSFLAPSLTIYRDIDGIPGFYLNFGLSHSIDLSRNMTLDLSGSAGYYISDDDAFVEIDDTLTATTEKYSGLHDGLVSASLTIPLNEYMTLTPSISYSFPLSDKADNLLTATSFDGDSDFLYGGVNLSIAF